MALALQNELDKAQNESQIRAVLLTGMGRAFCAGQDLQEAISSDGPELHRIVKEHYNPIIEKIRIYCYYYCNKQPNKPPINKRENSRKTRKD